MDGARGKAVVVKVGGSCLDDLDAAWWDALATIPEIDWSLPVTPTTADDRSIRAKLIVVHGWSRMVSAATPDGQPDFLVDKHGHRSRYTTPAVLEEIERVAAGLRARIAALLGERGLRARAVSGAETGLLRAEVRASMWWVGDELVELTNLVGPVRDVDRDRLAALLDGADALVVSPLATAEGHPRVNTDADRAAAALAAAAGAERLALVMDAPAVLADGEPVRRATRADLSDLAAHARGGMAKKLRAVDEALAGGVRAVAIGNAPAADLLAGRAGTLVSDRVVA